MTIKKLTDLLKQTQAADLAALPADQLEQLTDWLNVTHYNALKLLQEKTNIDTDNSELMYVIATIRDAGGVTLERFGAILDDNSACRFIGITDAAAINACKDIAMSDNARIAVCIRSTGYQEPLFFNHAALAHEFAESSPGGAWVVQYLEHYLAS